MVENWKILEWRINGERLRLKLGLIFKIFEMIFEFNAYGWAGELGKN